MSVSLSLPLACRLAGRLVLFRYGGWLASMSVGALLGLLVGAGLGALNFFLFDLLVGDAIGAPKFSAFTSFPFFFGG